jgi:hypothetical protein
MPHPAQFTSTSIGPRAELVDRTARSDRRGIGDVQLHRQPRDLVGQQLRPGECDVGDRHPVAGGCQLSADRTADASGATRDQSDTHAQTS